MKDKKLKQSSPTKVLEGREDSKKLIIKKKFDGVVLSDKMNKTIVVKVDSTKTHPKYQKRYTSSKKYKVHDEKESFHIGDKVSFIECRPLSKDKRWRVIY